MMRMRTKKSTAKNMTSPHTKKNTASMRNRHMTVMRMTKRSRRAKPMRKKSQRMSLTGQMNRK